jgi:hypothetical protein
MQKVAKNPKNKKKTGNNPQKTINKTLKNIEKH